MLSLVVIVLVLLTLGAHLGHLGPLMQMLILGAVALSGLGMLFRGVLAVVVGVLLALVIGAAVLGGLAALIVGALVSHLETIFTGLLSFAAWAFTSFVAGWVFVAVMQHLLGGQTPRGGARTAAAEAAGRRVAAAPVPGEHLEAVHGQGQLVVMGSAHVALQDRLDPYTRTRFDMGEQVVRCGGGCGRAYKLVTCEALQHRCPVDGASLRPRRTPAQARTTQPCRRIRRAGQTEGE